MFISTAQVLQIMIGSSENLFGSFLCVTIGQLGLRTRKFRFLYASHVLLICFLVFCSVGSQTLQGEAVGFETEATAILDTMAYIRPDIYTLVIGQAFGNAAMLLAAGKKGHRYALPHSRIMTCPPRMNRSFGNVSNVMIKANELENATETYVHFMSKFTGQNKEEMRKVVGRNRYFTPEEAIDFGIIDRIAQDEMMEKKDYEAMLRASQASQRRSMPSGGAVSNAEA